MEPARPRAAMNSARARWLHDNLAEGVASSTACGPCWTLRPLLSDIFALVCSRSESLHRRNLALAHDPTGFFFTDHCSAEIRNFSIDLLKGALREFLRWREVLLEITYVLLRAFDLIGRQSAKDSLYRFNFRDSMAKHHYVVSGLQAEANGIVQSISRENRAHVEIVSHDQTVETKFVAQQLCNNPVRHGSRRGLWLEAWIPRVANHHAVYNALFEGGAIDLNRPEAVR